jgi:hypothetical protein
VNQVSDHLQLIYQQPATCYLQPSNLQTEVCPYVLYIDNTYLCKSLVCSCLFKHRQTHIGDHTEEQTHTSTITIATEYAPPRMLPQGVRLLACVIKYFF